MEPQVSEATGKSSFIVLERYTDQLGKERVKLQGMYGTSYLEVIGKHNECEFNGDTAISHDAWADIVYCTGCNYSVYYPLGD